MGRSARSCSTAAPTACGRPPAPSCCGRRCAPRWRSCRARCRRPTSTRHATPPLTTRDPRRLVEEADADLAVGYFPNAIAAIVAQGGDATLHHRQLYATEYVCVMRHDHPLAGQELTLDTFVAAHHLLVTFSGRAHGFVDEALATVGRQRRIVLTVNQFATAGSVVARSDLLTVLPRQFLPATGAEHRLVQKPLPLALASVNVEMMWHLRKDDDPAHRWLRGLLVEAAARQPMVRH